jgi:glycosyltransferase involved in cell wall biosynthesis
MARTPQAIADVVSDPPTVSVVIPTRNEARNLPHVFRDMPPDVHEVILVDGRSSDGTVEVARRLWPSTVVIHQEGKGKGNAMALGFAAVTGDVVVMLDADGSADPAEIPRFVQALVDGADVAKGSRFLAGGGSTDITAIRRLGNEALTGLVNVLWGTRYTDLCYGYNAMWSWCARGVDIDCDGFEVETLINIRIAEAGWKVAEVPSIELERIHGSSNLRAHRDGWRVLRTIGNELRSPADRRQTALAPPARTVPSSTLADL